MKKSFVKLAGFALAGIMSMVVTGCAQPSGGAGDGGSGSASTVYKATYQFTESMRTLPAGTDGTAGTSKTYVEFGDWPQTVAAEGIKFNSTPESNGYYVGSDGNYYAKCAEYAVDAGNAYKYTDGTQAGRSGTTTRYFKVEPIKWRVLTNNYSGKKLLFAENILTANVPYYEDKDNNRTIGANTVYPNNYEHSQIRAYLNGLTYQGQSKAISKWDGKGFLQTAFTSGAQALIAETQVDNSASSTGKASNTFVCGNTEDKIFLLSCKEVDSNGYFEDDAKRIRKATDYAKANCAYQNTDAGAGGYWGLRSPSYDNSYNYKDSAYVVMSGGSIYPCGVKDTNEGVVPALAISF